MGEPWFERGYTRSGRRFAQGNVGYYPTIQHLLAHHPRLLQREEAISNRVFRIGANQGSLIQTTIRFSVRHDNIREALLDHFSRLFAEHNEGREDGFEVTVTFNAVLSNAEGTSFSLFYGHDFRAGNLPGAAPELRYQTSLVRTLGDVARLPVTFDFERLAEAHRHSFENSEVHVARFLNIIYLVCRYVSINRRAQRQQPL